MADEEQLSHKKKVRCGHRAYAKTILSKINTVLEGYDTENDREKLEGYKVILKERFEAIKTLLAVILDAAKEEEINNEIEEAGHFDELIHGILVKCNAVLTLKEDTSDTNGNVPGPSSQSGTYKPKLPKLSLKKVYGESTSWPSWWDSFYSAVHANKACPKLTNSIICGHCSKGRQALLSPDFSLLLEITQKPSTFYDPAMAINK